MYLLHLHAKSPSTSIPAISSTAQRTNAAQKYKLLTHAQGLDRHLDLERVLLTTLSPSILSYWPSLHYHTADEGLFLQASWFLQLQDGRGRSMRLDEKDSHRIQPQLDQRALLL